MATSDPSLSTLLARSASRLTTLWQKPSAADSVWKPQLTSLANTLGKLHSKTDTRTSTYMYSTRQKLGLYETHNDELLANTFSWMESTGRDDKNLPFMRTARF